MPELPDVVVYVETLTARIGGRVLEQVHLRSPFVLRSVDAAHRRHHRPGRCEGVAALGKRIVLAFDGNLFLVIHLMIAGRLRWRDAGPAARASVPSIVQASFAFDSGTLFLTEAGSKKRASIRLASGEAALAALDPGGVEPLDVRRGRVPRGAHAREPHAQARADRSSHLQRHRQRVLGRDPARRAAVAAQAHARAQPTRRLTRLHDATRATLLVWIDHLRREARGGFPEKVTAFHDAMAVHGRFRQPCPVCGAPVQRIVYATNECNYCAVCQTDGRRLADRALSRLLEEDWPRTLDDH